MILSGSECLKGEPVRLGEGQGDDEVRAFALLNFLQGDEEPVLLVEADADPRLGAEPRSKFLELGNLVLRKVVSCPRNGLAFHRDVPFSVAGQHVGRGQGHGAGAGRADSAPARFIEQVDKFAFRPRPFGFHLLE